MVVHDHCFRMALLTLFVTAVPAFAQTSAEKLKARISELVEIVPGSLRTDIELNGAAPPLDALTNPRPASFHARGEILTLFKDRNNWYNSTSYLVLVKPDDPRASYRKVIEVQDTEIDGRPSSGGSETVEIDGQIPDDGQILERVGSRFRSVRFFNGKLDGTAATLVIVANKQGESPVAPSKVMISLYELQADEIELPGHFVRMTHFVTSTRYCNTDFAVWHELAIPLPALYRDKKMDCGN